MLERWGLSEGPQIEFQRKFSYAGRGRNGVEKTENFFTGLHANERTNRKDFFGMDKRMGRNGKQCPP